ncbi:hypothetical protein [Palleronia sp. THAF1]|uniref:hypothetical protein n=1 Tax=Palleronia sp. THAF1 TaxID=2587842 RepID=UPI000F51B523|nr:hypothetical protein [Palleronia sp. THAF1]
MTLGYLRRSGLNVAVMGRDGALRYIGEQASRTTEPHARVGQAWWTLWPKDNWPALRNAVTRAGLGDVVTLMIEPVGAVTLTPVRNASGLIQQILAVHQAQAAAG